VYVSDAEGEEQRGIGCPADSVNVATRFQIPRPGRIQPERVTSQDGLTLPTRDNYCLIANGVNTADRVEHIIQESLMPVIHPVPSVPTLGLYRVSSKSQVANLPYLAI
jgi:hypothetical protein